MIGGLSLVLAILFCAGCTASASPGSGPAPVKFVAPPKPSGYKVPRTPYGDPDLQGVWTNASLTVLETPEFLESPILKKKRAKKLRQKKLKKMTNDSDDFFAAPNSGSDPKIMLGYNRGWLEPNRKFAMINNISRAAWIIDPPDGRIPYTPAARMSLNSFKVTRSQFENPETAPIWDRCLLGFGSPAGPPMLNQVYNNAYQIAQSPGHVAIWVEMVHDVRIIRLDGKKRPPTMRPWMGDSIGRWQGDTLVVETTQLHPDQRFARSPSHKFFIAPNSKVTEWFTRISQKKILYQFQVEEPTAYTQPWRGEVLMNAVDGQVYEYACHEGNRSLPNQLAGAKVGTEEYIETGDEF